MKSPGLEGSRACWIDVDKLLSLRLPDQFQAELNVPWRVGLRGDLAETRGREVSHRIAENDPVEWIRELGAELEFQTLQYLRVLDDRRRFGEQARPSEAAQIPRGVPQGILRRIFECIGIDPDVACRVKPAGAG